MIKKDDLIFMPCFSLEPNKVTSYNQVFYRDRETNTIKSRKKSASFRFIEDILNPEEKTIKRASHNLRISENAHRTMKRRINWLYYLAKSRRKTTYQGKTIYNFKMAFITLTLPSKQRTCTKDVTNTLLNQFLTEVRQRTKMENYVWRLEFQKNGNVHYHIATDTYIDYHFMLKLWNRILKYHGYIEPYKAKFETLSLSEYRELTDPKNELPFKTTALRYARGKKTKWEQPPTIDVKSVVSNKAIANYISKYFAKDNEENPIKNELDTDENTQNCRLWFCSRSLSKLNTIKDFCEAVDYDIFALVSYCKRKKTVFLDFATVVYYDIKSLTGKLRVFLERILKDYSKKQGYQPAN